MPNQRPEPSPTEITLTEVLDYVATFGREKAEITHGFEVALKALLNTGLVELPPEGPSIEDWLNGLDWKEIEGETLSGEDFSAPVCERWRQALLARVS